MLVVYDFYFQKLYVIMDRSSMKVNRLSKEYENGVVQFLEFAEKNIHDDNEIFWCPCTNF